MTDLAKLIIKNQYQCSKCVKNQDLSGNYHFVKYLCSIYICNTLFRELIDNVFFFILSMREPRMDRMKSEEVHFQDDSPEDYQVNETETQVQNDKDTI